MNENTKNIITTLCICFCLVVGYENIKRSNVVQPIQIISSSESISDELKNVKSEFQKIESEEDKKTIYKLFLGSSEYLLACESLTATNQFDPILGRVQSSYGWERDKYSEFTDAVSDYLISVGYEEPKELKTSSERKAFAKIFTDLAEVTKHE
tara:strand:+ start:748 stop:1206 length:459 start_codon:yes stop_codon:yes gene_type:complete